MEKANIYMKNVTYLQQKGLSVEQSIIMSKGRLEDLAKCNKQVRANSFANNGNVVEIHMTEDKKTTL